MVEAIFPSLKDQGAEEGMCFSDAFTDLGAFDGLPAQGLSGLRDGAARPSGRAARK
jgi:hypothetical protein